MAKKDNTIIYNSENFLKGIARSAYVGFQDMENLNFSSSPGILKARNSPRSTSGTPTDDDVKAMITQTGTTYILTTDTREVYQTTSDIVFSRIIGNDIGIADGAGLGFWKEYLIVLYRSGAQAYKSIWSAEFISYSGVLDTSPAVVGQDDVLYFGTGKKVSSLTEVLGQTFDPANGATFTFKEIALDLPEGEDVTSLAELGSWLTIGTNTGKIYLWDRESTSFELPLIIGGESGVSNMITVGQVLYALTADGRLYASDGTTVKKVFEYSDTLSETDDKPTSFIGYAMTKVGDKVLFAIGSSEEATPIGIFEYDTEFKTTTIYNTPDEFGIATGELEIPAISWNESREQLYYSFIDSSNSTFGTGRIPEGSGQTIYNDDEAFFITDFRQVGTKLSPRTFTSIQVECSKNIDSTTNDDSIKVYYRTTQDGAWVLIKTFDNTGDSSFYSPFGATTDKIQFKCVLNDNAELLELRIN